MRMLTLLFLIVLSGTIYSSANPRHRNTMFELPKSNYKLITQQTIYSKKNVINRDFDQDGIEEQIIIERDHPNGFRILGIQNHRGYNLIPDLLYEQNIPYVDEFEDLLDDFFVQISYIDLDNDNKEELILTIGDMLTTSITVIYKIRRSDTLPFVRVCQIEGQDKLYLTEDKEIIVPIGSQGLYEGYKMQDGRIKITNKI